MENRSYGEDLCGTVEKLLVIWGEGQAWCWPAESRASISFPCVALGSSSGEGKRDRKGGKAFPSHLGKNVSSPAVRGTPGQSQCPNAVQLLLGHIYCHWLCSGSSQLPPSLLWSSCSFSAALRVFLGLLDLLWGRCHRLLPTCILPTSPFLLPNPTPSLLLLLVCSPGCLKGTTNPASKPRLVFAPQSDIFSVSHLWMLHRTEI